MTMREENLHTGKVSCSVDGKKGWGIRCGFCICGWQTVTIAANFPGKALKLHKPNLW